MSKKWKVGIFLFNDVEVLDFAGPFEVFSVTYDNNGEKPFDVKTVSETGEMVQARNGLRILPDYHFENAPEFDILVIPGGSGTREIEHNQKVIHWIQQQMQSVTLMTSVCTGAFLLAKAGLLTKRKCTTHWGSLERLQKEYPAIDVKSEVKFVDEGNIITSAGISAGINMSFHVLQRLVGKETANATAHRMEYDMEL
ncbi:DJ-1/PfpI family protein [Gracilibacillus caseinilyticus]|uniref:DJ-1/PfpI family protein n=1 Tax=Gracilibacillus caseinilyticus TaxID=2932256 RepID=A0ABY4F0J0_9BACI|nr:DJ-1/PfpI family protein [Gracilibacillus caseinilyticus]UOQ50184.1 DJ-1/PfpI family protein [Gracilibacillus caseinilyticus]